MSLDLDGSLLLAGAGNMGYALLCGWRERGLHPATFIVQDPAPAPHIKHHLDQLGIAIRATASASARAPSVIVVAVKPQVMDEVFPPLAKLAGSNTVVLSVAAG